MPPRSSFRPTIVALAALLSACNTPKTSVVAEPVEAAAIGAGASRSPGPSSTAAPTTAPSATASAALPAPSPAEAAKLLADAERCFADPSCDPAQAEAMYRRADDGGAPGVSCYQFYYGMDVHKDLPRARACFERVVAAQSGCHGSSPDLDRAYLAAMLIDAQGGPADPARATALFADCYADATVIGLSSEATQRAALAPDRTPLDFCEHVGGTTITIGQCAVLAGAKAKALGRRVDRELATKLDAESKRLAGKAREAWSKFADKQAEAVADRYRGGSIQSNAWKSAQNALEEKRIQALSHLFEYKPSPSADPAQAERDMEKAYREASDGDAQHKRLLGAARKAWTAYRDAEIAFYVQVFGDKLGKREVERDLKTTLTKQYQAELEDMQRP
ncbi:Hypothetical protein A7982_08761 [Minicystis rosea]|nr:Hypothetical protein A7982_08761 [Minicystis rosea]